VEVADTREWFRKGDHIAVAPAEIRLLEVLLGMAAAAVRIPREAQVALQAAVPLIHRVQTEQMGKLLFSLAVQVVQVRMAEVEAVEMEPVSKHLPQAQHQAEVEAEVTSVEVEVEADTRQKHILLALFPARLPSSSVRKEREQPDKVAADSA
jgi:hypothetical protein